MGSYFYVDDPESELGYLPIPEDDYLQAVFRIAQKHGLKITDKMILAEIKKTRRKSISTKGKNKKR